MCPLTQPNALGSDVDGEESLNLIVTPPTSEPFRLPQRSAGAPFVSSNGPDRCLWYAIVCTTFECCSLNRNTAQLLSLSDDLLTNVASHLRLVPPSLVAFFTCCNALWALGGPSLCRAQVEHQLALCEKNDLETRTFTCTTPHIEPKNLDPEDLVLRHMARGVAIAIGALMYHVELNLGHGQPYLGPSVLSERRCARELACVSNILLDPVPGAGVKDYRMHTL